MKRIFNLWLMAAIVYGFSMSVMSCEDDDKLSSEEQKAREEQKAEEKATAFWDVVSQLVSIDDVTDDYQDKTFEPTYGIEDSTNSVYRIVYTNDMATAAMRFANLVGAKDIDEETASYEWSDPEIGSMTYTRGGTAANWATVDVDIKQIPHLQKIIYRAGGEGENGKFSGKAYYRFGDVVSRQVTVKYDQKKNNDNRGTITEYWICVRPSFGPEGKEDSHWVCVNTVSDKNYKYYKASTGTDYWLPTKIGTDKENMQNFAELLWAICYPDTWFNNVFNHHTDGTLWGFDGVPFFTDFKGANLKYHNQYFWENVRKGWEDKQVVEKALNLPDIGTLADLIPSNGVRLLYWGYSWIFTTSWDCELHEAIYTNGSEEAELNMHRVDYKEDWDVNMKNIKFDVRAMGKNKENYKDYFNNDGKTRWVIRHATGKELADNKKYDVKQPINGVEEVYRYYRDAVQVNDLGTEPETTEKLNWGFFRPGVFIRDENGTNWMCISSWIDSDAAGTTSDRLTRFISLDGLTSVTENIGNKTGQFIGNSDLVPESQAPLVAAILTTMTGADSGSDWGSDKEPFLGIKNKFKELYNRELRNTNLHRDTLLTYDGKTGLGFTEALSIFYTPYGGRAAGTQPYIRFIYDGARLGPARTIVPTYMKYPYAQFFKKYNDNSGQTLDAVHLFTCSNYITAAKPVKADMWSICKNSSTGQREGDFKDTDLYIADFDWKNFQDRGYKSAYHEPIMAVRYMEIPDDDAQTFKGTYNGKKYELVYSPSAANEMELRFAVNVAVLANFHNYVWKKYDYQVNGCYMDNVKWNLGFFKTNPAWEQ